jgi:zinc transport system substrate-binding protein
MGACGESSSPRDEADRPLVAVTLFPVGDMTRALAGSAVEVVVLLPAGASPATFEPSPDLVRRLAGARAVVSVGAGADGWGADLARVWGASLTVLTEGMTLEYGGNPHIWLDPILVRDDMLPKLTEVLVSVVPQAADSIRHRAMRYSVTLTALDRDIRKMLSSLTAGAFVATHPAWPYFAHRYGLRQVGVVYPSPGRELSPRELAKVVKDARRAGVRAVFTEPQLGQVGARALAEELDATVGMLDPLGGRGVEGRDSYPALLMYNAREFSRAMSGRHE